MRSGSSRPAMCTERSWCWSGRLKALVGPAKAGPHEDPRRPPRRPSAAPRRASAHGAEAARAEEGVEDADAGSRLRTARDIQEVGAATGALIGEPERVVAEDSDGERRVAHEDRIALALPESSDAAD